MGIGSKIRQYRESKGLSQLELGNRIGYSRVAVTKFENESRKPNYNTMKKIAEELKVPLTTLLGLDESSRDYKFTKEAFLDELLEEQRYTLEYISQAIGIDKESIVNYFTNPFLEDNEIHFALGHFLMFTSKDLATRIELDKLFFNEADKTQLEYYKNAIDYCFDIFQGRSVKNDKGFNIDPELIKQAREMFNAFYPTTKKNNDSLEPNEMQVLDKFRLLNEVGQQEGIKRIDELGQIEKYKRRSNENQATKEESSDIQE